MLPERLLNLEFVDDEVIPRFLSPRDAVWVRGLMHELDGFVGRTGRELDEDTRRLLQQCMQSGASRQAAVGMVKVMSQAWTRKVVSAARPVEIRRVVFEHAGKEPGRLEALRAAARELDISADEVLEGLFADRPAERRLQGPEQMPDPLHMIELYNLELVQGLLARSERVAALVRENVRSVVRFAKLKGLLCTYTLDVGGTMIELSGPLALFRNTLKYGNALGSFFPSLVVTPGWSLGATCLLRPPPWLCEDLEEPSPRRYRFVLDASAPVHTTHKLPNDTDSAVERKLMRDVKRAGRGWLIQRETSALRAGSSVFFPDFKLVRDDRQLLVEIVGYYTPEYLASKLRKLREAAIRNFIVCIDESLACADEQITADIVLRYNRRVDAAALLDAADRLR